MLRLDLKAGDSVQIGEGPSAVIVTIEEKSGKSARVAFEADRSVSIKRVAKEVPPPSHQLRKGLMAGATA